MIGKLNEKLSAPVALLLVGVCSLADLYLSFSMILYFWDGEWLNGLLCFVITVLLSPISAVWRFTSIVTWIGFIVCLIHRFLQ